MKTKLFLLQLLLITTCYAQTPSAIDTNFNRFDIGYGNGIYNPRQITSYPVFALNLKNGKIVLYSDEPMVYDGQAPSKIIRLTQDGSFDKTYTITINLDTSIITLNQAVELSDGRILLCGLFKTALGQRVNILRISAEGAIDTTFKMLANTVAAHKIVLLRNGKIILFSNIIDRLTADGNRDGNFRMPSNVSDIIELADGRLIVVGPFTTFPNKKANGYARTFSSGEIDPSFQTTEDIPFIPKMAVLQEDGKVILIEDNTRSRSGVLACRLDTNGFRDGSFDGSLPNFAQSSTSFVKYAFLQENNQLIIGGDFQDSLNNIQYGFFRLRSNGTLDSTFSLIGSKGSTLKFSNTFAAASNKDFIAAGEVTRLDQVWSLGIRSFRSDGTINYEFNLGEGLGGYANDLILQPDGNILVAGSFVHYNRNPMVRHIMRIKPNGEQDQSFEPHPNAKITKAIVADDGKVFIAGYFNLIDSAAVGHIALLDQDGRVNYEFNGSGKGTNKPIESMVQQPDGRLLLFGYFTEYNGRPVPHVIRIFPNGQLDESFQLKGDTLFYSYYPTLSVDASGMILISGIYKYDGVSVPGLIRLFPNGDLDHAFIKNFEDSHKKFGYTLTGSTYVKSLRNKKYYLSKDRPQFLPPGSFCPLTLFLQSDGSLDSALNSAIDDYQFSYVTKAEEDKNGNLVLLGSLYGTGTDLAAIQLFPDGGLNSNFSIVGFPKLTAFCFGKNGASFLSGSFTNINGIGRNGIAKITSGTLLGITGKQNIDVLIPYPNPSGDFIQLNNTFACAFRILSSSGTLLKKGNLLPNEKISIGEFTAGLYYLEIIGEDGQRQTLKVFKN